MVKPLPHQRRTDFLFVCLFLVIPLSPRWAVSNREMLMAQNSSLEFKLHRLYFISLLMDGTANQREALQYAKNFQPFALNHQKGQ